MSNPPPINLGPYVLNAPTEVEKGHIRDSLDLGSASLLQGGFIDTNRLVFTDPNNSQRTITLDKTQLTSAVADRLRIARIVNVTGHVTTATPNPVFDGTADLYIPVTINDGVIDDKKLATDSVIASKIKNGAVTPDKLSAGGPSWSGGVGGTTFLTPGLELGKDITANSSSFVDFHSSVPSIDYDARIERKPGVNGTLDIINSGTGAINIRGLSLAADNSIVTTRQLIGAIEITGNQINTTAASNVEIAINYENSDSTINNFLNTTIFNGKRAISAKFYGDTKTFESFGPNRGITDGQIGWATAGLESRSGAGNALVAVHAAGATAALIRHVRGGEGLQIRTADDGAFAPLGCARMTSNNGIVINDGSPTLYLQDTNHRSGMVHVNSNIFYVLRGKATNSLEWEAYTAPGGIARWPLEINLENNWSSFGGNLSVYGTLYATGDIVAYSTSDKNLKSNICNIENPLDKISQINGVTFDWDTSKQDTYSGSDVGVIAQEVETILPDAVCTREDGYKAVKYDKLIPLLIESIKELQQKVQGLEAKLSN